MPPEPRAPLAHRQGQVALGMAQFLNDMAAPTARLYYGNRLGDWLLAGGILAAVWSALWLLRWLAAARYRRPADPAHRAPVRLLLRLTAGTRQFLLVGAAVYAAHASLALPAAVQAAVGKALLLATLLQSGLWAGEALRFYLDLKSSAHGADRSFSGSLDIINFVAHMLIWSLVTLLALENVGVNITALLAGLGVGGVAVALALQNILGDLFASLSIALDKPFVVGDSLAIDAFSGSVEHIGIKTTRLRSDSGEQIILSNADILKSRVRNYGRAAEQRTLATLRIPYATPVETLRALPGLIEAIVRAQPNARYERCHLRSLGDSALQFELSYFARPPVGSALYDLHQAVNLGILEELHRLGIEFAYPTQQVLLRN